MGINPGANIPKLYLLKISKWFMLYMPIIILFYEDNGLSMSQIMLINSIYAITIVATEIPSGFFSDRFGRKVSLILGMLLSSGGILFLSLSYEFLYFSMAAILLALGGSFVSGSDSALLYDSLQASNQKDQYIKYEGYTYAAGNIAEAVSAIIGGFIAAYAGLRMPIMVQVGISLVGFFAAVSLYEVPIPADKKHGSKTNIYQIIRFAFVEKKALRWAIIFSAIIGCSTLTMAWFAQAFLGDLNLSLRWIGIIWAGLNIIVGIVASRAHKIYPYLSDQKISLLILVGISFGFVLLGFFQSLWGLFFIVIVYLIRGLATPVLKDYVNRYTPSLMRATVLSFRSLFIRFFFAMMAPFLGWLADVYTLGAAFSIAGLVFLVFGLGCLYLLFKAWKLNQVEESKSLIDKK